MHCLPKIIAGPLLVAALALSGCGDSGGGNSATTGGGQSLEDGVLDVFAVVDYPPYTYVDKDGKTMRGMEIEMLDAISEKLGVKVAYHNMQFDAMIPAINNHRADLMVMAMADSADRRKQVDFIDLYRTTLRVITREGNPTNLTLGTPDSPDVLNLCGHSIATTTGGQQEQEAKWLNDECGKAGKPPIEMQSYTDNSQEYLAYKTGRADFGLMVPANADYFIKNNPGYEMIPGSFPTPAARYTGWILAKDNRALQDQLIGVINELIDDGTWTELLAKWGVSESDAVIPPLRNEQPTNEGS